MSPKIALSTSCILIVIVSISVISFQPISASTEREACVTELLQVQETPDMLIADWLDPLSNAAICLSQSELDSI